MEVTEVKLYKDGAFLIQGKEVVINSPEAVEAVKKFIGDKFHHSSNVLAGITAVVLSTIVRIFYCVMANVAFNSHIVIILIALVFLSWLCAMVGYDKVIQAITQIKSGSSK